VTPNSTERLKLPGSRYPFTFEVPCSKFFDPANQLPITLLMRDYMRLNTLEVSDDPVTSFACRKCGYIEKLGQNLNCAISEVRRMPRYIPSYKWLNSCGSLNLGSRSNLYTARGTWSRNVVFTVVAGGWRFSWGTTTRHQGSSKTWEVTAKAQQLYFLNL